MKEKFKKVFHNKIFRVCFIALIVFVGIVGISAASKYYKYVWTNDTTDTNDNQYFVTNDVLEYEDGFIAVGFKDYSVPSIRILSEDGLVRKEVTLDDLFYGEVHLKEVQKYGDGYRVFGVGHQYIYIIDLSSSFKVDDIQEIEHNIWVFDGYSDFWFEEDEDYYYFLNGYDLYSRFFQVNKETYEGQWIYSSYYTDDEEELLVNYYYADDYLGGDIPIFMEIKDNKIFLGVSYENDDGDYIVRIAYLVDGEEIWYKEYVEKYYVKDGIFFNDDKILYSLSTYDTDSWEITKSELVLVDLEGNELGTDSISNYLHSSSDIFITEHMVLAEGLGFFLNGSEVIKDEESDGVSDGGQPKGEIKDSGAELKKDDGGVPPAGEPGEGEMMDATLAPSVSMNVDDAKGEYTNYYSMTNEVILFKAIHQVYTKTDGNGTVEATQTTASWGDGIEFTITPNEGYVLGVVKVTDSEGNTVEFTDYKFTMPNADVTIEVTFYVENPETYAFIGIAIIALLGISGWLYFKNRKQKEFIEK